jgi:hypothetical protein
LRPAEWKLPLQVEHAVPLAIVRIKDFGYQWIIEAVPIHTRRLTPDDADFDALRATSSP